MERPNILNYDKVTKYANDLNNHIDKLNNIIDYAADLLAKVEKDSCYYCPLGCDPSENDYDVCVDPEGRITHQGCRAEKWKEWLENKGEKIDEKNN